MPRLTDKEELLSPDSADLVHVVDVSDITGSAEGTSKKTLLSTLKSFFLSTLKTVTLGR